MNFAFMNLLYILTAAPPVVAFINPLSSSSSSSSTFNIQQKQATTLQATEHNNDESRNDVGFFNKNSITNCFATAAMSALLWVSPAMLAEQTSTAQYQLPLGLNNAIERNFVADAQDKASATGSRVNKDAESLLRLGLPIKNKEVSNAWCVWVSILTNLNKKICVIERNDIWLLIFFFSFFLRNLVPLGSSIANGSWNNQARHSIKTKKHCVRWNQKGEVDFSQ